MVSPIEIVLAKLKVPLNSNNKSIIKQIRKYELDRDRIWRAEHSLRILEDEFQGKSLVRTAKLLKSEADRLKVEMTRLDVNITDLISKLVPDPKE